MKTFVPFLFVAFIYQFGLSQAEYFNTIEKINWDYSTAIIEKNDGNLLIASSSRSQFITSYDILLMTIDTSNGEIINEHFIGDSDTLEFVHTIEHTSDYGYILGGTYRYDGDSGPYILKLDTNETVEWDVKLPDFDFFQQGFFTFEHSNQSYYMLGNTGLEIGKSFLYNINVNGDLVFADSIDYMYGSQIIESHDNNLMIIGSIPIGEYDSDIVLAKINTDGDTLWTKQYNEGISWGSSIAKTNDGGYLLATYFDDEIVDSGFRCLLMKVDSEGNFQWKNDFSYGIPSYIKKTGDGFVLSNQSANSLMSAVNLDEDGNVLCYEYYEGRLYSFNGTNILKSQNGHTYMVGHFNEPTDIFIAKMSNECDNITDIKQIEYSSNINIAPNPTMGVCTINKIPGRSTIKIFNNIGQLIYEKVNPNETLEIETLKWQDGLHILTIQKDLKIESFKIIKISDKD